MACPSGNRIMILISVNFIIQLAGLCLPNWVSSYSGQEHGGLFIYCTQIGCDSMPLIFHVENADYGGITSLTLVGTGLLLVSVFVSSILAWRSGWTKITFFVMSGFLFTAATCTCCGVTWFVLNFSREGNMYKMFTEKNVLISTQKMMTNPTLSFAFYMCAISGFMSLVLGVVTHTVGKSKPKLISVKYNGRIVYLQSFMHRKSHMLHPPSGILIEGRHLLSKRKFILHVDRTNDNIPVT